MRKIHKLPSCTAPSRGDAYPLTRWHPTDCICTTHHVTLLSERPLFPLMLVNQYKNTQRTQARYFQHILISPMRSVVKSVARSFTPVILKPQGYTLNISKGQRFYYSDSDESEIKCHAWRDSDSFVVSSSVTAPELPPSRKHATCVKII